MPYLIIAFFFGLAGGVVGKIKGCSFFLWFLISAILPFIGLIAAVLYRYDRDEPRRRCPDVRARSCPSTTRCAPAAAPSWSSPARRQRRSSPRCTDGTLGPREPPGAARSISATAPRGVNAHASGRCPDGVPEGRGCRRRIRLPGRREPPHVRRPRTTRASATCSCATRPAAATPPRATRRPPARSASCSPRPARAPPTSSPRSDAMMDSVPTVFITGQVRTDLLGTDGFQEADTFGITMPIVKHSFMIQHPPEIPRALHEAFHLARTGRPGPVADRHPDRPLARRHRLRAGHRRAPARLPADHRGQPEADPPGGQGARQRRAGRCSTPAAAWSTPTRRPS